MVKNNDTLAFFKKTVRFRAYDPIISRVDFNFQDPRAGRPRPEILENGRSPPRSGSTSVVKQKIDFDVIKIKKK